MAGGGRIRAPPILIGGRQPCFPGACTLMVSEGRKLNAGPTPGPAFNHVIQRGFLCNADVDGLHALGAAGQLKLDRLAFS